MPRAGVLCSIPGVLVAPDAAVESAQLLPEVGAELRRLRLAGVPVVALAETGWAAPRLQALVALAEAAGGSLTVVSAPDAHERWRAPRPGLVLRAAKLHELDLPRSWLVGTNEAEARAAALAGCAGAVLIGADPLAEDLGVPVARAASFAAAPRHFIPRGGGCWHGT